MRHVFLSLAGLLLLGAPVSAGSSNSLMDVSPDGKRLIVANTDNGTVTIIDTAKPAKLREIAVGEKPEGVTWIGNGPLAAVTIYSEDRIAMIDTDSGKLVQSLAVDDEPYGIVTDRAGRHAWVTHDYPGLISEIDLQNPKVIRKLPAGKFIRGIALSPDESRVYVTEFFTAKLIAIDLKSGTVVDSWQRARQRQPLPQCRPASAAAQGLFVAHAFQCERDLRRGAISPQLTVFDLVQPVDTSAKHESRRKSFAMDTYNGVYVVTNPWEAAISPDGKRLYTIYAGTDDMNVSDVIDDDYKEIKRVGYAVRSRQKPARGPRQPR